jgi:hypothetical protein
MLTDDASKNDFVEFACRHCDGGLCAIAAAADRLALCPNCQAATPIPGRSDEPSGPAAGDDAADSVRGGAAAEREIAGDDARAMELPQAAFSPAFGYVPPAVPSRISVGDIVGRTWDIFFHRFFELTLVVLATTLGSMVALAVGLALDALAFLALLWLGWLEAAILVFFVGLFPAALPAVWIHVGQVVYVLKLARGQKRTWRDLLRGGCYSTAYLHTMLITGLLMVPGLLLCLVPGLIILAVLTPAWYLVVERKLTPSQAIRAARQLARGNLLHLVLVMALWVGVESVGQLIGPLYLLVLPFVGLLWTVTYLRLTGQSTVCYEYQPAGDESPENQAESAPSKDRKVGRQGNTNRHE